MPKGIQIINEDGSERDLSADSTLQEVRDTIGQESGATVLSRLLDIWNKLTELFNTGVAKIKIWDGTEAVEVLPLDVNRLAVDVNSEGGVSLQRFIAQTDFDVTGNALNTLTDTILLSEIGNGQLDFIAVSSGNSNFEVAIFIDGDEKSRLTMEELGADLGLSNATNVPMWVETANKNFRFHPNIPTDFTVGFEIKAKATGAPLPTVTWIVQWRLLA